MSGAFSRNKGRREEVELVHDLNKRGYQNVRRVPLSGAAKGFKFDVLAEDNGTTVSFELKTRNDSYKWLYDLLGGSEVLRISRPSGGCVALGYDPRVVDKAGFHALFSPMDNAKLVARVFKLADLKKDADFLVIKDNRKRRLYLKFWS